MTLKELHAKACQRFGEEKVIKLLREFYDNLLNESSDTIKEIIEDLNHRSKGSFKASSVATRKHIKARLSEGYKTDDFKRVNEIQCIKWLNTPEEKYLRPQTLYNSEKFAGYLADWHRWNNREMEKAQAVQQITHQKENYEDKHKKEAQAILQAKNDIASGNIKNWYEFESYSDLWHYLACFNAKMFSEYTLPDELRALQGRYLAIKIAGSREKKQGIENLYKQLKKQGV